MRLTTLTLLVLIGAILVILLFPQVFLESTATVISDPHQQQIGEILASISFMTARPMTASDVYDFLIIRHPESGEYYRLKSEALLAAGDMIGAMSALDEAIRRDIDNPHLLVKKVRLLYRSGKINDTYEADKILERVMSIQTENSDYLSEIADITLEKANYLCALDTYSRVLSVRPDDGLTLEKRSDVIFALLTIPTAGAGASKELKTRDLYSEGIRGYNQAIQLNPERKMGILAKIEKRSEEFMPRSIEELQQRYQQYRYLQPGEDPLPVNPTFY